MSDGIADKLKVTSSNASVATATIEGSTLKVTGVASGSAVIEVEAEGITVDDKPLKARLNVAVKAQAQGARFEGHTGVFLIDVGYPLDEEVRAATKNIKAYDDDGTLIPAENISITGTELIDVTAAEGTRFQLEISATKKDGTKLTAVITIEIFGQSVEERVVIFGPSKLTYYIGSDQQGFDLQKEFSARNLNTKEDVPVSVEYLLDKDITLQTQVDTMLLFLLLTKCKCH